MVSQGPERHFLRYHFTVLLPLLLAVQVALFCALVVYNLRGLAKSISAYYDVPYVPTPHELLPIIADALDIQPRDVVYDLGCGDGRLLFYCARRFPNARFVGVERNPLLV